MKKYFVHNYYMAEIADCIINDGIPLKEASHVSLRKTVSIERL